MADFNHILRVLPEMFAPNFMALFSGDQARKARVVRFHHFHRFEGWIMREERRLNEDVSISIHM